MKKVAVFFDLPDITDFPFSKSEYVSAYRQLGEAVTAQGGEFYIVRGQFTYQGRGSFSRSWQFSSNADQAWSESGPVTVESIFDKGSFVSDGAVRVLNESFVNEVCTNKWLTYNLFKAWSPRTWLAQSDAELRELSAIVMTELMVAKPVDGHEGKGVVIGPKEQVAQTKFEFPLLVQEFLDSSCGVPGVVDGIHDLRVALVDGEVMYSYFRTPPENSYLASVAQGGKFKVIENDQIPASILEIVQKIDQVMSITQHRFYGIDFAMTPTGPKIIELNSRLGLLPNEDHPIFAHLKTKLAQILLND